ncbi:hypothetical protein VIGAN_01180000 [Vigna angularis var. angularis]|uniref:Uncharacterized protein n=1 Tax=Vigna angularis var. angularis TaxID=157739 RepID=A0A0S3R0W1_PHAAN|nr:hypothetical protein VIGAN_01180000 [Vigna angularis var. angularis]
MLFSSGNLFAAVICGYLTKPPNVVVAMSYSVSPFFILYSGTPSESPVPLLHLHGSGTFTTSLGPTTWLFVVLLGRLLAPRMPTSFFTVKRVWMSPRVVPFV